LGPQAISAIVEKIFLMMVGGDVWLVFASLA
jgi:hypothetical protein